MINIQTTSPRISSLLFCIRELFGGLFYPDLESFDGDAMLVPLKEARIRLSQSNRNCRRVVLLKRNFTTLELRHVEINVFSSAVSKKPKRSIIFWPTRQPSRAAILVTQLKSLEICKTKNPVELKRCKTSSSYRVYNLMKLKPQTERQF